MTIAPPVMVGFPGSGGFGPVGQRFWTDFCDLGTAQAILKKVQALSGVSVNVKLIDGAGPGGDYGAFQGYFFYTDATTRMWQIIGTITDAAGNVLEVNEFAGDLADRESKPWPTDQTPYPASGAILKYWAPDPTDSELYWGN